jgi:hypothetical protein
MELKTKAADGLLFQPFLDEKEHFMKLLVLLIV